MELTELIESIDIVDFISQYADLEERNGEYWCLSLFKEEKTPSFSVRRNPPVFYDYSSGLGGNVYSFVRYYHKCGAKRAIEILKNYAGISEDVKRPAKPEAIRSARRFSKPEKHEKPKSGTVLSADCMKQYDEAPDKLELWRREGISQQTLDKFQVRYDPFSNRIVYPIYNLDGKIVNIGGRTLDPQWKEKRQPKYCYFYSWGVMNVLYGLFENLEEIRRKKEVILFEGCKSVLLANTWGVCNTAAVLTSHLNPSRMKLLISLGCRVVFALDKEINIRDDHNIQMLRHFVNVEYLRDTEALLDDKDAPVDKGFEVFQKLYEGRFQYR